MTGRLTDRVSSFFESSIRNRLIAVLILATVVPIGASTFLSYAYSKQHLKEISIAENLNILGNSEINIDNYLRTLTSATMTMYSNSKMYSILENSSSSVPPYEIRPYIMSTLQSILASNKSIEQVYLSCVMDNTGYLLTKRGFFSNSSTPSPAEESSLFSVSVLPTHISHDFGISPSTRIPNSLVFSIQRNITSIPEKQFLGTLTIDVNLSYLSQILASLQNDAEETVAIITADGDVICSTDSSINGKNVSDHPWVSEIIGSHEEYGELLDTDLDHEKKLYVYQRFSDSAQNWIIYKSVPEKFLYRDAEILVRTILLVSGLFLLISIILIIGISIDFTRPIQQLNEHIKKIQSGETESHIDIRSKNEIGSLADSFNNMMDTVTKMLISEYKLKLSNKSNQLSALQAQIDSHFINNSIQSIGVIALRSGQTEIYNLLTSFGEMFNYSMNLEPFVLLRYEIEYTENYLRLQRERFPDKLHYYITADECIENVLVPKMLLQPIMENYFKHGFGSSYDGGTVRLGIGNMGNELQISVEDDGKGIPEEKLRKIISDISDAEKKTDFTQVREHIGLPNLAMRLALYYDGNASIDIGNLPEGGFYIHVLIPKDLEDHIQEMQQDPLTQEER